MTLPLLPGSLLDAELLLRNGLSRSRSNSVIPIIIVIAIVVLLLLAASIVAAAIILCSVHGGVLDTVVRLNQWYVSVHCHKL